MFFWGERPLPLRLFREKRMSPKKKSTTSGAAGGSRATSAGASPFSKEFLNELRERLLSEREQICSRLQSSHRDLRNNSNKENIEETGSKDFIHAVDISMMGSDAEKLNMIDEALENLRRGTYGICQDCGEPISEGRLRARPFAHYCIKCKSIREERGEFDRRSGK